jgi:hypothetical protein
MHCARDRLLQILAESAADMRNTPAAERRLFVTQAVSTWRQVLSREYGGESLRIYAERMPTEQRHQRNARILESLRAGVPRRAIARAEGVSMRLIQLLVTQNPA